jgi:hypothetical protein
MHLLALFKNQMKKLFLLSLVLVMGLACSCNKEDNNDDCPATENLCVEIGHQKIAGPASWYRIPGQNRFRILWEEGQGATYRNIEIDVYTADSVLTAGTYNVNSTRAAGSAAFQWYASEGGWYGNAGSLVLEAVTATQISGSFSGVLAKDGAGEVLNVTKGKLQSVPKQ